jgi:hypothetical protein
MGPNAASANLPSAQYRAVGTPVVHMTEGVPVQAGVAPSEKKVSAMVQRGPSTTPAVASSPPIYGYYAVDRPTTTSTTTVAHSGYGTSSNNVLIAGSNPGEPIPYVGGNPFVDDFSSSSSSSSNYHKSSLLPSDQQAKQQMRLPPSS